MFSASICISDCDRCDGGFEQLGCVLFEFDGAVPCGMAGEDALARAVAEAAPFEFRCFLEIDEDFIGGLNDEDFVVGLEKGVGVVGGVPGRVRDEPSGALHPHDRDDARVRAGGQVQASRRRRAARLHSRPGGLGGSGFVVVLGDMIEGTITATLLERANPGAISSRRESAGKLYNVGEFAAEVAQAAIDPIPADPPDWWAIRARSSRNSLRSQTRERPRARPGPFSCVWVRCP